jgi:hypothetical protein
MPEWEVVVLPFDLADFNSAKIMLKNHFFFLRN